MKKRKLERKKKLKLILIILDCHLIYWCSASQALSISVKSDTFLRMPINCLSLIDASKKKKCLIHRTDSELSTEKQKIK